MINILWLWWWRSVYRNVSHHIPTTVLLRTHWDYYMLNIIRDFLSTNNYALIINGRKKKVPMVVREWSKAARSFNCNHFQATVGWHPAKILLLHSEEFSHTLWGATAPRWAASSACNHTRSSYAWPASYAYTWTMMNKNHFHFQKERYKLSSQVWVLAIVEQSATVR